MKAYLIGKYENDLKGAPCLACPILQEFKISTTEQARTADFVLCPSATTVGLFNLGKVPTDA